MLIEDGPFPIRESKLLLSYRQQILSKGHHLIIH